MFRIITTSLSTLLYPRHKTLQPSPHTMNRQPATSKQACPNLVFALALAVARRGAQTLGVGWPAVGPPPRARDTEWRHIPGTGLKLGKTGQKRPETAHTVAELRLGDLGPGPPRPVVKQTRRAGPIARLVPVWGPLGAHAVGTRNWPYFGPDCRIAILRALFPHATPALVVVSTR